MHAGPEANRSDSGPPDRPGTARNEARPSAPDRRLVGAGRPPGTELIVLAGGLCRRPAAWPPPTRINVTVVEIMMIKPAQMNAAVVETIKAGGRLAAAAQGYFAGPLAALPANNPYAAFP